MSDVSNLDILESKISRAIEKLQAVKQENDVLKTENQELSSQLSNLEREKGELRSHLETLEQRLQSAEAGSADLSSLKGRVEGARVEGAAAPAVERAGY